jgi:hypothetical protein
MQIMGQKGPGLESEGPGRQAGFCSNYGRAPALSAPFPASGGRFFTYVSSHS